MTETELIDKLAGIIGECNSPRVKWEVHAAERIIEQIKWLLPNKLFLPTIDGKVNNKEAIHRQVGWNCYHQEMLKILR